MYDHLKTKGQKKLKELNGIAYTRFRQQTEDFITYKVVVILQKRLKNKLFLCNFFPWHFSLIINSYFTSKQFFSAFNLVFIIPDCIVCLMSVTYVSSLILNTIICCLVSIPYKQCNSTKAGMQYSHLCNPPSSRLFESVWGTWIQQLCSHQRWCPGFWQTEAVHLCVSTLPDKRYVVTGYNRLQVKDG